MRVRSERGVGRGGEGKKTGGKDERNERMRGVSSKEREGGEGGRGRNNRESWREKDEVREE